MEILSVVVPDLIRYSNSYFQDNSLFHHLEHVRKGSLPKAVGPHPLKTMVDGIEYCASAIPISSVTRMKFATNLRECEKVPLKSDFLKEIFGEDTVLSLGKTNDDTIVFLVIDRKPEERIHVKELTNILEGMIRLTTDLKLRQLTEIETIRLPIELAGSFTISVKCEKDGKRTIEIFDENLTQCGFVKGFVWRNLIV